MKNKAKKVWLCDAGNALARMGKPLSSGSMMIVYEFLKAARKV